MTYSNVVVTGGGNGLGRSTSKMLAAQGSHVAVLDLSQAAADETVAEIISLGGHAVAVVGDISKKESAHALFNEATEKLGTITGLLNNAGVYPRLPMLEVGDVDWDTSFGVNVRGLYHMMVAATLHMKDKGGGRIVNVASIDAFKPHPKNVHYAAMKAAVVSLTKSFGQELASSGILVNAVAPGGPISTKTALSAGWLPDIAAETPIGRVATPEEIAEVTLFLLSDKNKFMVGETVVVAGGYYIP